MQGQKDDEHAVPGSVLAGAQDAYDRQCVPGDQPGVDPLVGDRTEQRRNALCTLHSVRSGVSSERTVQGDDTSAGSCDGGFGHGQGSPEGLLAPDSVPRVHSAVPVLGV
uniref:(northern house mosquito) hypothetical protein n=1 Tax=Culex pipiens TaxID=7175 RepID=A0A8D8A0G9_CULPI